PFPRQGRAPLWDDSAGERPNSAAGSRGEKTLRRARTSMAWPLRWSTRFGHVPPKVLRLCFPCVPDRRQNRLRWIPDNGGYAACFLFRGTEPISLDGVCPVPFDDRRAISLQNPHKLGHSVTSQAERQAIVWIEHPGVAGLGREEGESIKRCAARIVAG